MSNRKAPQPWKAGSIVPPRTFPSCHDKMLLLFEALEEFAPAALQTLEEDVLLATPEHLRPLTTGNTATRPWSESFRRWQRRHNLDRWKSEEYSLSFESVADLLLLAMETSRRSKNERGWSTFKSTLGVVLSPEVTAALEWRTLEAVDPELVERLRIEDPIAEPWNPVLERWSDWKKRKVQGLDGYRQAVEAAFHEAGAERRKTKRKASEHFECLVRYQVREETFGDIGEALDKRQVEAGEDSEARVRKAVQETAKLIGLRLRPAQGRPAV